MIEFVEYAELRERCITEIRVFEWTWQIRSPTNLGKLELVMGKLVGYGLRKPVLAGEMGYMLGVCLKTKLLVKQKHRLKASLRIIVTDLSQNLFEKKEKQSNSVFFVDSRIVSLSLHFISQRKLLLIFQISAREIKKKKNFLRNFLNCEKLNKFPSLEEILPRYPLPVERDEIAGEKPRFPPLLIEKNGPNHPWKISIWDGSSRKQITRRERGAARGLVPVGAVNGAVISGTTSSRTPAGLIDRNWEDDREETWPWFGRKNGTRIEKFIGPPLPLISPSYLLPSPSPSIFFISHRLKGSRRGWKREEEEEEEEGVERRRKAPPKRRGSLNKNRVYPVSSVAGFEGVWIVSTSERRN